MSIRKIIIKKNRKPIDKTEKSPTFAKQNRGVEQLAARQAHNLEAGGSSPSSATIKKERQCLSFFCFKDRIDTSNPFELLRKYILRPDVTTTQKE
jgi:hypothetical protein